MQIWGLERLNNLVEFELQVFPTLEPKVVIIGYSASNNIHHLVLANPIQIT